MGPAQGSADCGRNPGLPNVFNERKNLAGLFLNRGGLGVHARRQIGKGREFEQLRQYFPGDSYEDLHWKATAKRGMPVTKVFQIERTQEVYVVLDSSRLSSRRAQRSLRPETAGVDESGSILERFITAALIMAWWPKDRETCSG